MEEDETGEDIISDAGSKREKAPPLASSGDRENPKLDKLVGVRGMEPFAG